jgi:hypothetical protein
MHSEHVIDFEKNCAVYPRLAPSAGDAMKVQDSATYFEMPKNVQVRLHN